MVDISPLIRDENQISHCKYKLNKYFHFKVFFDDNICKTQKKKNFDSVSATSALNPKLCHMLKYFHKSNIHVKSLVPYLTFYFCCHM